MEPGEVLANRFAIEMIAGTGGMGTVYRARDLAAGGLVAVKVLAGVGESDAVRFAREAAVLAELVHPGIVRYVAHGVSAQFEHYLVMEWLEGETLHERLSHARLSLTESLTVVHAIAEALSVAHRRGIVHRDLKPMNLFLSLGELARVKLLDFGIARQVAEAGMLTRTGTIVGTPGYMAPEQVRGETELDARTDVFALGCVLYRCLTGTATFGGEGSLAVLAKILVEDVLPPSTHVPEVPPELDALVLRMLAKRPADRPRDAAEVATTLSRIRGWDGNAPETTQVWVGSADTIIEETPRRTSASGGRVLTDAEQRLVSIVLSGPLSEVQHTGARDRLRTIATAFGGRLERIADGAHLVLFANAGVATDHAMRAARCALAIRDVLAGVPLVVASGRAAVDRLPVGAVIDRAAAVLDGLGLGQIAIDDATAGLLDERFVITEPAPHRLLRGMREGAEPARTLLGRATSIVGRDRELAMLDGLWAECVDERVARAVLVTAPPGAGKSRLRHEYVRRVLQRDEHAELLIGRGDVLQAGSPFAMLADAIRRSAGVREGDALEEQRAGLLARVQRHMPADDGARVAHLLGEFVGIAFPTDASAALRAARADPVVKMDAMREAWIDWLTAECSKHPVLVVLEDLHWGDRATIDYVDIALRDLAHAPLMIVALARPEIHDQFPRLWAERDLQEIRLPALTKKASEKLVRELLGDGIAPQVVGQIVDRSAGNAFFLEELIRAVAEGRDQALPDSVLSMLQLRLDQLGAEAKRALRAASVFGAAFWRRGVDTLLGVDARAQLAILVERELVAIQPDSRLPGDHEYVFRHDLVREAAYATMSANDRVLGHRLAGHWLVEHGYGDALALAGHFSIGEDLPRAAEYYARAAEHALAGNDNAAAIAHADHGLACGVSGELAGRLHRARAEAFNWRGEYRAGAEAAAAASAAFASGSAAWFMAQDELFYAIGRIGEIPRAIQVVHGVTTTVARPGAQHQQLRSVARATIVMFQFGPPEVRAALAARVEELAMALTSDPSLEQRLHAVRALVARDRSDVTSALALHDRAIVCCEITHNQRELAFTCLAKGNIYEDIGAFEQAIAVLERGIAIAERIGVATVATLLYFSLARALSNCERWQEARSYAERALAGCDDRDRGVAGLSQYVLATIALELGELDEAVRQSELAIECLTPFHSYYASNAFATLARSHLRRGDLVAAHAATTAAKKLLRSVDGFQGSESIVRLVEIEVLEASGLGEAAREATHIAIARIDLRGARIDATWRTSWL
ncbi:MAG TPA: protein kinase, partial [Kofleriaceae bacterium]